MPFRAATQGLRHFRQFVVVALFERATVQNSVTRSQVRDIERIHGADRLPDGQLGVGTSTAKSSPGGGSDAGVSTTCAISRDVFGGASMTGVGP